MRILLVAGNFYLAEGIIAKGIVKALDEDEVFFFSVREFKYRLKEFIELTQKVDVVHWLFNAGNLDEKYIKYFKESAIPNIATVHHVCEDEMYKVEQASYANIIHVVSSEWMNFIKDHTPKKVLLANLGIDHAPFKELKTSLYSGYGSLKIGMMGFYPGKNNRKRMDIAIEVFKKLIEKKISIELVVQGVGFEKYYKDFDRIGLKFNHSKLKSDNNFLKFYERIHIYMCTSDIEGGPLTVLEAMACGIPVISTKVGLANDLLSKGGGVLCDKRDVDDIADGIIKLKNNGKLYNKLSEEAKNIAENHDWIQLKNQYKLLYKETIKSWELTNAISWVKQETILNASRQRKKEMAYSNIHQVRSLLHNKSYIEGFLMLVKLLFSNKISIVRKQKILYESLMFFIKK